VGKDAVDDRRFADARGPGNDHEKRLPENADG
jgi:hypothetical protein